MDDKKFIRGAFWIAHEFLFLIFPSRHDEKDNNAVALQCQIIYRTCFRFL